MKEVEIENTLATPVIGKDGIEVDPAVELTKSPRNFRTAIDIENFYRFLNDNDLRKEAKIMMEMIQTKVNQVLKKKRRESKQSQKKQLH